MYNAVDIRSKHRLILKQELLLLWQQTRLVLKVLQSLQLLLGQIKLRPLLRLRCGVRAVLLLHGLASSVHTLPGLSSPVGHLVGDWQVPCLLHSGEATRFARCWWWG